MLKERSTCSKFRGVRGTCLKNEIKKNVFEDHGAQYLYQWLRMGALCVVKSEVTALRTSLSNDNE